MICVKIDNNDKVRVTLNNKDELKEKWFKEYPLDTIVEIIHFNRHVRYIKLEELFDYIRTKW